jgi:putative endopeptidase
MEKPMRAFRWFSPVVLVSLTVASPACERAAPTPSRPPSAAEPFDLEPVDKSVDPCVDFYEFACNPWIAAHPLPAEQSRFGRFNEVRERNLTIQREILEEAAGGDAKPSTSGRQIGDFYAACMDEEAVQAKKAAPIDPELERIAAVDSTNVVADVLAHLHSIGVGAFFAVGPEQDLLDATQVIASIDQGGLGLLDRDDYTRDDPKSAALRRQYTEHVTKMLALLGEAPEVAAADAAAVLTIETKLAGASLSRVERRVPANLYHKMTVGELEGESPGFDWRRYFGLIGAPPIDSLNVRVPAFAREMSALLQAQPLPAIRAYLRWHLVHAMAPFLSSEFQDETFAFYGKIVSGIKELKPRWKRCVGHTDANLGEALGRSYVDRAFGVEGKQRTSELVAALQQAFRRDILDLPWMTDATKTRALEKLDAVANKIGYPEKWRDYSAYQVVRDDLAGNVKRGASFELHRQLDKIGKPVDRTEWEMTPPTVNAYYDPQTNSINFPAGILQPPFYGNTIDDAVNFGGIGAVIGHELTHGFDDQGRLFDKNGNLTDWWTPEDTRAFDERASCLVEEYSAFSPVAGVHLSGELTLGENIADNGGLRIALMALTDVLGSKKVSSIGGFTQEQRLFLSWGQIWCENRTEEAARLLAVTDPHSPGRFRVNGVVSNMPEFQRAFACRAGQPMVRENACRVW